jgi:hypothetical protein
MCLNTQWKLTVRSSGKLCPWPEEAEAYAKRLGNVLVGSWSNTTSIQPVDIPTILSSFKPRSFKLSEIATEYVGVKGIDPRPPRIALQSFISLAGDRDVGEYMREDPKLFVRHLEMKVNKTATIRRRINSLSAIPDDEQTAWHPLGCTG